MNWYKLSQFNTQRYTIVEGLELGIARAAPLRVSFQDIQANSLKDAVTKVFHLPQNTVGIIPFSIVRTKDLRTVESVKLPNKDTYIQDIYYAYKADYEKDIGTLDRLAGKYHPREKNLIWLLFAIKNRAEQEMLNTL